MRDHLWLLVCAASILHASKMVLCPRARDREGVGASASDLSAATLMQVAGHVRCMMVTDLRDWRGGPGHMSTLAVRAF